MSNTNIIESEVWRAAKVQQHALIDRYGAERCGWLDRRGNVMFLWGFDETVHGAVIETVAATTGDHDTRSEALSCLRMSPKAAHIVLQIIRGCGGRERNIALQAMRATMSVLLLR